MRCQRHDLALAPDGSCVRCRREEETATGLNRRRRSRAPAITAGVVASCAVAGAIAWNAQQRALPPPPPPAPRAAYAAPSSPPLAALEPAAVPSEQPPSPAPPSASTPLSRAMHLARITLYSRPGSPECARARVWLLDRGYVFKERAVDADVEAHAAWVRASPGGVVPAFDIDGQAFAGFDAARLEAAIEYAGAKRLQR